MSILLSVGITAAVIAASGLGVIALTVLSAIIKKQVDPVRIGDLTCYTVSPLIEEIGKFVSIEWNCTVPFLIVFNFAEFMIFFRKMRKIGIPASIAAQVRVMPIILHVVLTGLHVIGLHIPALILHILWNWATVKTDVQCKILKLFNKSLQ